MDSFYCFSLAKNAMFKKTKEIIRKKYSHIVHKVAWLTFVGLDQNKLMTYHPFKRVLHNS